VAEQHGDPVEDSMPKTDVAIITIIPEEYEAVASRLKAEGCSVTHDSGNRNQPNQYGWVTGELSVDNGKVYHLVLAAAVSPGPTHMANAVNATLTRFKPRYVLLVGIAGGFPLDGLTRGDVAISSVIYDYEYGKITTDFQPRHDNTYQVDGALLRSAVAFHARDKQWTQLDTAIRPEGDGSLPKLLTGAVASGSKVVDNAEYDFFQRVHASWPKLLAVEMEGAGAVSTINTAVSGGLQVGFLMVRGISDMPKDSSKTGSPGITTGNTAERDTWKKYAAAVAASFTVSWVKRGWPVPPARRSVRAPGTPPVAGDDDGPDGTPPAVGVQRDPKSVAFDPFSASADSSIWLGFIRALAPAADFNELARLVPESMRATLGKFAERHEPVNSADISLVDSELTIIRTHLDRHETDVAEVKLKELESRAADQLRPQQWYELKALRSRIYVGRWEWEKAGRELLDAKRHTPETERARVNEALGYELVGERDRAHALATALRAEFPHSIRLLTVWVRTAPTTERLDALVAATGLYAKGDEELTLALAHRAMLENRFEEATTLARRATELDPNSPHAWFTLGEATHMTGFQTGGGGASSLLNEAAGHYDRAVHLCQKEKLHGLEAAVRVDRAKVRHLLGDARAEADYQRAIELAQPDQVVRTSYAGFLLEIGRPADALRELIAVVGEPDTERTFIEAAARYERNEGDDRERAAVLLQKVIGAGESDRWADAHVLLVQWAVENKAQVSAKTTLSRSRIQEVDPQVYHTLDGWLTASGGDKEAARTAFRCAIEYLTPLTRRDYVFLLAQALVSVGEDSLALPLLERCHRPGVFDYECQKLLDVARRLERHEVLSRVCRELREAGVTDSRLAETEVSVLQRYDPKEALKVACDYLAKHPDNRHVALWQSSLALRLSRPDLVISDLARLPAVGEVTAQGSGLVLNILVETNQPLAALRYAYDALRQHFDDEFAHGQYLAYFLKLNEQCPELKIGGRAGLGMAVCYHEERNESEQWAVIEDGPAADLGRNEYAPDHPVSKALEGHTVGEIITLSDSGVQPRPITIKHACHKFIYRFQDCRDRYQFRFPGGTAIQMVHVGSGEELDPSPIIKSLEDRKRYIEDLDKHYRNGPMPFVLYASLAGCDELAAWGHLASNPELGIRSGAGDSRELRAAMDRVKESKALVLDLTAIISLGQLDLLGLTRGSSRRCVVGQSVFERIQDLADRAEDDWGSSGSLVLAPDGGLVRIEVPVEQRKVEVSFLTRLRDGIRDGCDIRPCPQAAALDPNRREQFVRVLGRPGLDSILLASESGTMLWTDDSVMGMIGRTDFHVQRVWTQAVLFILKQEGSITQQEFDRATARMAGWNYQGVMLNEETLVAAADIADWRMDQWPVPAVMRSLQNTSADSLMRLRVAVHALRSVWRRELPTHSRHNFLDAILDGLRSARLVRRLYQAIPSVFSVDVLSADEVREYIAVWLRNPPGPLLP
jgi:nucleoside phosphorylase/predicted Zn-dependent protease